MRSTTGEPEVVRIIQMLNKDELNESFIEDDSLSSGHVSTYRMALQENQYQGSFNVCVKARPHVDRSNLSSPSTQWRDLVCRS